VQPEPSFCMHRTLDVVIDVSSLRESHLSCDSVDNTNGDCCLCKKSSNQLVMLDPEDQASDFLIRLIRQNSTSPLVTMTFILPTEVGFCVRSDFLERRLEGYPGALRVEGFLEPRQKIDIIDHQCNGSISDSVVGLQNLLPHAVGAVHVECLQSLMHLKGELANRLAFPWISPDPIPEKRIAWIRGYEDRESGKRIWQAAHALGIKLVLIDREGHWAQEDDTRWSHLREGFIPTSLAADDGFVERIVAAVSSYDKPIDNIVTCFNPGLVGAAQAREILGFHTMPAESYIVAADKFRTRELEPDRDEAFKVSGLEELHGRISSTSHPPVRYPLIVKPCMGWGSEGVSKVQNEGELVKAVAQISSRHITGPYPRTDAIVEPYVDGPELDVNVVLIDRDVVFIEVADDFPKAGDKTEMASFLETSMVLPTALPASEVEVAKKAVHQSLLSQGFTTGVFHCEGRIRYSSSTYDRRNGLIDLYPKKQDHGGEEPSFFLHEINARPGGYFVSSATLLTYGVDYYACHMLAAVHDHDRCRALSIPFSRGAQWWMEVVIIQEDKTGTMKTADAGRDLVEAHADLKLAVVDYKTHKKKGDRLHGPHATLFTYLAYFSVMSRESRTDCLRLAEKVRQSFKYEIE
jgi:biotin carboxylase